jgi:Lon protease-like protein
MFETLPAQLPVMTLPKTVLFPRTVLPLFIFEPRYRKMLSDVLAGDRIFAVAGLAARGPATPGAFEPPHRIATAGVVRLCQTNENGTSNVLLEGLTRIEILAVVDESPYRVIRVRPLPDEAAPDPERLEKLRRELLRTLEVQIKLGFPLPSDIEHAVRSIDDPGALCDLLVFSLIRDPVFQQSMLETTDTVRRLASAVRRFRLENRERRLHRKLQGTLDNDDIGHN